MFIYMVAFTHFKGSTPQLSRRRIMLKERIVDQNIDKTIVEIEQLLRDEGYDQPFFFTALYLES